MSTSNSFSFLELVSTYKVKIPIIQRDYAQGRKDSKAREVRKNVVSGIIAALNGGDPLTFDFIYGRVDNGAFIPVDGQQRLTTLFLFHLYLLKEHSQSCSNCPSLALLNNFSYATRQSSREFCQALVKYPILPGSGEENVSEYIRDQPWFFTDWSKDPTIDGMLRMLDEIHEQIKGKDTSSWLEKLMRMDLNCPVTFQFLDMGEHELTDELYLKMNARGLPLDPYENFKAKFEDYLSESCRHCTISRSESYQSKAEDWEKLPFHKKVVQKMDEDWLDFFWRIEKENAFATMLKVIARFFYHAWMIKEGGEDDDVSKPLTQIAKGGTFISFAPFKAVLERYGDEEPVLLTRLFVFLDTLAGYCKKPSEKTWFDQALIPSWRHNDQKWNFNLLNPGNKIHSIAFAAVTLFPFSKENTDEKTFRRWMRVVWNIVGNSDADEPAGVRLVNKLAEAIKETDNDVIKMLAQKKTDKNEVDIVKSGEYGYWRYEEEIKKAKLINEPEGEWEGSLIEAESLPFLRGKIFALLEACKEESDQYDKGKFKEILTFLSPSKLKNYEESKNPSSWDGFLRGYLSWAQKEDLPIFCGAYDEWKRNFDKASSGIVAYLKARSGKSPDALSDWQERLVTCSDETWGTLDLNARKVQIKPYYRSERWSNDVFVYYTTNISSAVLISDNVRHEGIRQLKEDKAIGTSVSFYPKSNNAGCLKVEIQKEWLKANGFPECHVDIIFWKKTIELVNRQTNRKKGFVFEENRGNESFMDCVKKALSETYMPNSN